LKQFFRVNIEKNIINQSACVCIDAYNVLNVQRKNSVQWPLQSDVQKFILHVVTLVGRKEFYVIKTSVSKIYGYVYLSPDKLNALDERVQSRLKIRKTFAAFK